MTLICGINPVLEALGAGTRHFDRLLVAKGIRNQRVSDAIARASRLSIPLRFEPRETLDRLSNGVPHQGLIAIVSAKASLDLDGLLAAAHDPGLLVVLDGVEDPRNLGAIIRTAEAAGAHGVVLPDRHTAGLTETVARASAGALEHVHVARVGNLVQAIEAIKARGYWVVGFDATGAERWHDVDLCRPVALVFGGEGRGIRRLVREHCDHVAALPLFGHVGSLNVSVAAGIALYEVVRQRGLVPSAIRPIPLEAPPASEIFGPLEGEEGEDPYLEAPHVEGGPRDGRIDIIDFHEDAAWSGPTVLKAVERRGRRPEATDQRRGKKRRPRPAAVGAPSGGERIGERGAETVSVPQEATVASPGPAVPPKRRRRRRGSGAKPRANRPVEAQAPEAAQPPPAAGGPAPDGTAPQAHRRRRRRRR